MGAERHGRRTATPSRATPCSKPPQDCYIHSERALVATIGVKDLVIVDTPDALLVADQSRAAGRAGIVGRLKQAGRKEQEQHLRSYRPWGFFETLNLGPRFQVKLLHVKPGGKLSMQMHHHRSEHWVVVHGTAKVTIGSEEKLVRENQSVYIVATQWHRLENPGKTPLEIIEVQIGSYLGEDDIVRADDVYNRRARRRSKRCRSVLGLARRRFLDIAALRNADHFRTGGLRSGLVEFALESPIADRHRAKIGQCRDRQGSIGVCDE